MGQQHWAARACQHTLASFSASGICLSVSLLKSFSGFRTVSDMMAAVEV